MSLLGSVISFATRRSARRFDAATRDARATQTELLMDIVRRNAGTEYGKRHGFASVSSVEDYQRQVPLINYEDIKEDVKRVTEGARNVLTAEDPVMFAQTSGTTGDPKFIPVTPSDQGQAHSDQMRTWLYTAHRDHPTIFDGKVVSLVSPAVEGHTPSGLPFGSTSGHIYRHMSPVVKRVYGIPYEVFEIEDYQAKYYAIMRIAVTQDVRMLATANPSSILKLAEKAQEFAEDIIRDVRDGALDRAMPIDPAIRAHVEKGLRPDPALARRLDEMRSRRGGRLLPGDYWPRLALIGCWKGGTVGHYLSKFDAWFRPDGGAPVPVRDWGYLSSECRGSIPLSDDGSKGALTVAANFFEFAAVEDVESQPDSPEKWSYLIAPDLEVGREYYIFVTTTSGLYRYDINDVIRVESRYQDTPEIVFLRKGRGMTNITGEKLSVNQVIAAVEAVSRDTGLVVGHFKAEADTDASRYVLKVEFDRPPETRASHGFLAGFDTFLKGINIEYAAKRDSARLNPPVLQVMREGWYERARRKQVAGGKRAFQAKTEVLSPVKEATSIAGPEIADVVELER